LKGTNGVMLKGNGQRKKRNFLPKIHLTTGKSRDICFGLGEGQKESGGRQNKRLCGVMNSGLAKKKKKKAREGVGQLSLGGSKKNTIPRK